MLLTNSILHKAVWHIYTFHALIKKYNFYRIFCSVYSLCVRVLADGVEDAREM